MSIIVQDFKKASKKKYLRRERQKKEGFSSLPQIPYKEVGGRFRKYDGDVILQGVTPDVRKKMSVKKIEDFNVEKMLHDQMVILTVCIKTTDFQKACERQLEIKTLFSGQIVLYILKIKSYSAKFFTERYFRFF